MPALELARFTLKPGAEEPFLAERDEMIAALRATFPGVRDAYLGRVEGDEWIDVVVWDSRGHAERAAKEVFDHPAIAKWFRHIDHVVSTEHADVAA